MKVFDVAKMQSLHAVEVYSEVPKLVTAICHANASDNSEFHCVWTGTAHDIEGSRQQSEGRPYCIKKVFLVPKQRMISCWDRKYGWFYAICVIPQFEVRLYGNQGFHLVAHMDSRKGFLIPSYRFLEGIKEEEPHKVFYAPAM